MSVVDQLDLSRSGLMWKVPSDAGATSR